jgi:PAS domain S-box-containing protein
MAILWPTSLPEPTKPGEALRRALGHAVALAEGGAGVLALRSDGDEEEPGAATLDAEAEPRLIVSGISRDAARRLIAALAQDRPPEPLDGRPRVVVLPDLWAGEVATVTLGDAAGAVGEAHLLGPLGFATRRPLADPARRQALVGALMTAIRQQQEVARLRQENRQLSSILHFSGDGIVTVDEQLRITGFNPAMEQMTAWRTHETLGRFYYDVLRPHGFQRTPLGYSRDPMVRAIATGRAVTDQEMVLLARDGQEVYVSVTAAAVRSPQGQPISGVLNVRDITRSREAEELRSTFVSVVSHELQTPIAIIKGYASTLAREDAHWDAETARERLGAIEEEADRLNHLVQNILYASRIQAGGLKMEPEELDLGEVTRSVTRRFRARSPSLEVSVRLPSRFPLVMADRERIEEVLMNLLDNAAKYSSHSGREGPARVDVRGQVTDDEVIISVRDEGEGIPLREQARIFDRFARLENTANRRTQGAGLGLYICRAIVAAHGGHIWLRSELGRGSTFSFSLPRVKNPDMPSFVFGGDDRNDLYELEDTDDETAPADARRAH